MQRSPARLSDSFPPLKLSHNEIEAILSETDALIAETLHASEDFIANNRQFDKQHWEFLKTSEQLQLYRTRTTKDKYRSRRQQELQRTSPSSSNTSDYRMDDLESTHSHSSSGSSPTASSGRFNLSGSRRSTEEKSGGSSGGGDYLQEEGSSSIDRFRPGNRPLVIVTGVLEGTVEDAAFGALADTEHRWRFRNSYVGHELQDGKLLATIQSPSEEDPFRFVGVKWTLRKMGPLIKTRDILYVESTGMALDSNGDRISYFLMHSIQLNRYLPELKEKHDITRAVGSICFIFREFNKTSVEIFGRSFMDHAGHMIEGVSTVRFAETLNLGNIFVEVGQAKKLLWRIQQQRQMRQEAMNIEENGSSSIHKRSGSSDFSGTTTCYACTKNVTKMGQLVHTGSKCEICHQIYCNKCTVLKKLSVNSVGEMNLKPLAFTFCVDCIYEAKQLSAWDVAIATMQTELSA